MSLWSWERLSGKISFSKRHIWAWLLKQLFLSVTGPAFQNSTDFKRTKRMVSNSKLPSMKKLFLSVSWASFFFSFYQRCTLMASSAYGAAGVVKCPRQPDVNKEINILPLTWKDHIASVMSACSLCPLRKGVYSTAMETHGHGMLIKILRLIWNRWNSTIEQKSLQTIPTAETEVTTQKARPNLRLEKTRMTWL